jgi:hypothetical protein
MFEDWDNFYIIVGSSAGALIGVMFIVATLTAGLETSRASRGARIYVTPIVFHFVIVVVVSAISAVPGLATDAVGVMLGACAALGVAYTAATLMGVFRIKGQDEPDWEDKCCYGILPVVAYLGLAAATAAVWLAPSVAALAIGAVMLFLLLLGIRNAWDLATFLVQNRP